MTRKFCNINAQTPDESLTAQSLHQAASASQAQARPCGCYVVSKAAKLIWSEYEQIIV